MPSVAARRALCWWYNISTREPKLRNYRSIPPTLSSGYNAAITTGIKHSNQLAVVAYNGIFYLYANQQFITNLADSTLSAGKVGVAAIDYKDPTEVEFTNAQVWTIPSSTTLTPTATQLSTPTSTQTPVATSTATSTINDTP